MLVCHIGHYHGDLNDTLYQYIHLFPGNSKPSLGLNRAHLKSDFCQLQGHNMNEPNHMSDCKNIHKIICHNLMLKCPCLDISCDATSKLLHIHWNFFSILKGLDRTLQVSNYCVLGTSGVPGKFWLGTTVVPNEAELN